MPLKLCCIGFHRRCVYGVGGMGDGIICLDCGYERYEESFLAYPRYVANLDEVSPEELRTKWWPEIERARRLPGGIDAAR